MHDNYTIAQLSQVSGIAAERLRYVVDQQLLPGQRGSAGRGTARGYMAFEAFGLLCAAHLIAAGLRRSTVSQIMDLLCTIPGQIRPDVRKIPLFQAFTDSGLTTLEIGDYLNVRICDSTARGRDKTDPAWMQGGTGAKLQDYEPTVVVALHLRRLRKCLGP